MNVGSKSGRFRAPALRAGIWPILLVGAVALAQQPPGQPTSAEPAPSEKSAPAGPAQPSPASDSPASSSTAPIGAAGSPSSTADSAAAAGNQSTSPEGATIKRFGGVPWEYGPYRVTIWIAAAPSPDLNAGDFPFIHEELRQHLDVIIGAPWSATVSDAPASLYHTVALCPELVTEEMINAIDKNLLKLDKLFVVSLSATSRRTQVQSREFDCHARTWGPLIKRSTRHPDALPLTMFSAIVDAFGPLARIEDGQGKECVVRGRATGLVTSSDSPAAIGQGDILQPIFRQNDRYGEPQPGRIEAIPFTYIQLTKNDPQSPTLWTGNVHSGMRNPIHGRSPPTSRRERWAIKVRPQRTSTTVYVESKPARRSDPKIPLGGIEVYAKNPPPEPPQDLTAEQRREEEKKNPPELLGVTDWQGTLEVSRGGPQLRVAYLKNGGLLLARLPIVPGLQERVVAEIPDDNPRLQAEGFVRGMNSEVMDLVVQRQLLAMRMRKKIGEGKLEDAQKLLEDFRDLKTLNDLQQMLNVQLQRQKPTNSTAVRQRIDKLYGEERELLAKYIDAELQVKLSAELAQARANPPEVEEEEEMEGGEDEKKAKLPAAVQPKSTAAAPAPGAASDPMATSPAAAAAPPPSS